MIAGILTLVVGIAVVVGVYATDYALIPGGLIVNYLLLIGGGGLAGAGVSLIKKSRSS